MARGTTADWRGSVDSFDEELLDDLQTGFPLHPRPYREVADRYGSTEEEVYRRTRRLVDLGLVRRLGPVLNPPVVGSSALAAVSTPDGRLEEVAEAINQRKTVNHNYERDHELDLWFVVTAPDPETRSKVLGGIGRYVGRRPLVLPLETEYYVDLAFPVANDDLSARESSEAPGEVEPTPVEDEPAELTDLEADVVLEVQDGLSNSRTPYLDLADSVDAGRDEVLRALESLEDGNCVKRVGLVVDHHAVGFDSNCMVVWKVPEDEVDSYGVVAGRKPYVSYCCHRTPRPERGWEYSMFTMVHGREASAVERRIDELADEVPFEHRRLTTEKVFKQTGVRYPDLVGSG